MPGMQTAVTVANVFHCLFHDTKSNSCISSQLGTQKTCQYILTAPVCALKIYKLTTTVLPTHLLKAWVRYVPIWIIACISKFP